MKIALYYYSSTGNTGLICEYIRREFPAVELLDITKNLKADLSGYDIVGLATPTFYLNIPPIVNDFVTSLENQNNKPAFLIATFGLIPGKVMRNLAKAVKNKGFKIIDYTLLNMPESWPPMIAKNHTNLEAPNKQEVANFKRFVLNIYDTIALLKKGADIPEKKLKTSFWDNLIPAPSHKKIMQEFGKIYVDPQECNGCQTCRNSCLYNAIEFNGNPVFLMDKCKGCFICYNKCPQKAIHTNKIKGDGQYIGPDEKLKAKFR